MSVLPDAGSELPADSDKAAIVCTAPVDEAVDNAFDVVGLCVGQLWFWTDSEVVSPLIVDEQSMISTVLHFHLQLYYKLIYLCTSICNKLTYLLTYYDM